MGCLHITMLLSCLRLPGRSSSKTLWFRFRSFSSCCKACSSSQLGLHMLAQVQHPPQSMRQAFVPAQTIWHAEARRMCGYWRVCSSVRGSTCLRHRQCLHCHAWRDHRRSHHTHRRTPIALLKPAGALHPSPHLVPPAGVPQPVIFIPTDHESKQQAHESYLAAMSGCRKSAVSPGKCLARPNDHAHNPK